MNPVMQKTPTLVEVTTDPVQDTTAIETLIEARERDTTVWISRITSAVGAVSLFLALSVWLARPGHYRLVLACLTVAMFAAILHSYTFENGN